MTKPIYTSKTFLTGLAVAVLPFLASVQQLLAAYPVAVSAIGVVMVILRAFTRHAVTLRKPAPASGPGTIETTEEPTE